MKTSTWGYNKKNILNDNELKKDISIYIHIEETTPNINNTEKIVLENLNELKKVLPNMR